MDFAAIDDKNAVVAQFAQVAGEGLRRHANARRDHFLAGLENDGRFTRQIGFFARRFKQVVE